MLRTRRLLTASSALLTALTLAACGSTVQVGADGQPLGQSAGSLGQPGSVKPGQVKGLKGGGAAGVPGSGSGAAAGGTGGGGGTTTTTSSGAGLAAVSGNEPIEVGITYTSDGEQANAALGAAAITRGNEKADSQAVIDDINANGGVNGHKLRPIFFGYSATSSDTMANQDQAACAHFTQDNHIAVALGLGGEVLQNCLAKAGVLMLNSGSLIDADNADLARYPYFFELGTLSQDRMMADEVNTLKRLDYFSGWNTLNGQPSSTPAKLGVLAYDLPQWTRPMKSVLLPALAKAGYPVDSENVYSVYAATTTSEVSRTAADVNNATLHFRQNGVTHVVMLDGNGVLTLLFAQSTRQQQYYPRIGMNTATGAQALKDSGSVDNNFLNGAVGLGWLPAIDLSASASAPYATPATRYCLQVMKERTGQTFSSTNAAGLALSKCDMGYLMAEALRKAGKTPTLDSARRAIEGMAGSYDSALLPSTYFSPTRHDAGNLGFDMKWDTGCSCTRYVGKHTIP